MKIKICAGLQYLVADKEMPVIGKEYILEDAENGTDAQNKAFHALLGEYWKSGCHSYDAKSFPEFKNCIKRALGAGFEAFIFVTLENGRTVIKDAEKYNDIPVNIRTDPELKKLARGRLKSWSDYTKKERRETMDKLISEMHQAGVQTAKFNEILSGMEGMFNA